MFPLNDVKCTGLYVFMQSADFILQAQ